MTKGVPPCEVAKRAVEGPYCSEKEFDFKLLYSKAKELVKEYDIKFNPEEIIPSDETLVDNVFEAGFNLFLEVGAYCLDTRRRILFEEYEVRKALANLPEGLVIGVGADAVDMLMRDIEDVSEPIVHGGPTGTLCSEGEIYIKTLQSYAQEPSVDAVGAGSLKTIDGYKLRKYSPTDFLAARRLAYWAREALRRVYRPGLHINDIAVVTPSAKIAACNPDFGIRPSDALIVSQMVEMKISFEHLALVECMLDYGCIIADLMTPMLGGYAGGPETTAVITVAEHLLGLMCYNADYHFLSLTHIFNLNNTDRASLWVVSVVGQALSRNSNILSIYDSYCAAGPGTDMILLEAAAGAITAAVSGLHLTGCGSCGGKLVDHATGLECAFLAETAKAATGMKREDANEIVKEIISKYEDRLVKKEVPSGETFQELYDLKAIKPKEKWVEKYNKTASLLRDLGVEVFNYGENRLW